MPMFFGGTFYGQWTGQWQPGQTTGTFEERTAILPLESWTGDAEINDSGSICMSNDVDVWVLEAAENYQDDISGVQQAVVVEDLPPELMLPQQGFPDPNFDYDLYEPGEPWHQTGPPTTWMDATCTIPAIRQVARTVQNSGVTTHNITLPSGMVTGNLCVVIFSPGSNVSQHTFTVPAGWSRSSPSGTTQAQGYAIWRVLDGTEGTTLSVTTFGGVTSYSHAFEIDGADPFTGVNSGPIATGTTNSGLNPLSFDAWSGTSYNTLFIEVLRSDDEESATLAYPTNATIWRDQRVTASGGNGGTSVGIAFASSSTGVFDSAIWGTQWIVGAQYKAFQFAIRGFCSDNANAEPAPPYFPDSVEPEAVFDESWFWTQTPTPTVEDQAIDPDVIAQSVMYAPDWLEPEAESDPSDLTVVLWPYDDLAVCTPPVFIAEVTSGITVAGTSTTVTMPSGLVAGRSLIFLHFQTDNSSAALNPITVPAAFTTILSDDTTGESWVTCYRFCDGTEAASYNFTTSANATSNCTVWHLQNVDFNVAPEATWRGTNQSSSGPFCDPLTPSWAATEPSLQFAILSTLGTGTTVTTYPPGYDYQTSVNDNTSCEIIIGSKQSENSATFNPAPNVTGQKWVLSGANSWASITAAVKGLCYDINIVAQTPDYLDPEDQVDADGWRTWPLANDPGASEDWVSAYAPDYLEPDDDVDTLGWQQSVTVEDFPPDTDVTDRSTPDDMALEDEPLQDGWQLSGGAEDFPPDAEMCWSSVPSDLEPDAEPLQDGWVLAPLEDTPANADTTSTSVPEVLSFDNADEGFDGWFQGPDQDTPAVVTPPVDSGSSSGGGGGIYGKRPRLWIEDHARRVTKPTWPNLPDVKSAPPWNPKVVTRDTRPLRPRLDAIQREWKVKMRRAREADDAIIAMIIAMLIAEEDK